ncbi:MAG: hypothetical protein KF884_03525 [Fimbriimonadaceae bacterium]|nr:hypothetical protein [Fimbriimonadaceae bacterium]QYK59162.1 MAG: hypothetical protein KF884_03525 [Fimbriimonadaceae bacterium]
MSTFSKLQKSALLAGLGLSALAPAATLEIEQVSWLRDDMSVYHPFSDTGMYAVRTESSDISRFTYDPETDQYVGYVNIAVRSDALSRPEWVVRNLSVVVRSSEDLDDTSFDIEAPLPCASIQLIDRCLVVMEVSGAPMTEMPFGPFEPMDVDQAELLWGGAHADSFPWTVCTSAAHERPRLNFAVGSVRRPEPFDMHGFTPQDQNPKPGPSSEIKVKVAEIEAVDEKAWRCSPAASARSLKYLAKQGKITVNDGIQKVTEDLEADMKTGKNGVSGTRFKDIVDGAKAYNDRKRLGLQIDYKPLVKDVVDDLKNGADVSINYELFIWARPGVRVPVQGHSAMVTKITPWQDRAGKTLYWIVDAVSDLKQGDKIAANNVQRYRISETTGVMEAFDERGNLKAVGLVNPDSGFMVKTKP